VSEQTNTPEFAHAQRQRKKVEALFAELKNQVGDCTQRRLTSIKIRDNEIQVYGTNSAPSLKLAGNYMAYRGAWLRFGKLTMSVRLDPD